MSGWTTRARRHGGYQAIEATRKADLKKISETPAKNRFHAEKLKNALDFLATHPMGTLNAWDRLELFGSKSDEYRRST